MRLALKPRPLPRPLPSCPVRSIYKVQWIGFWSGSNFVSFFPFLSLHSVWSLQSRNLILIMQGWSQLKGKKRKHILVVVSKIWKKKKFKCRTELVTTVSQGLQYTLSGYVQIFKVLALNAPTCAFRHADRPTKIMASKERAALLS